jgi:integrase
MNVKISSLRKKSALDSRQERALLEAIDKNSGINIWSDEFMRETIELFITIALALGLRSFQIRGIKIHDIDFIRKTISVNTYKYSEIMIKLPLPDGLAKSIDKFINKYSKNRSGSVTHDHLFGSNISQSPLSRNTIFEAFKKLSNKTPVLPENFSVNLLRSTYINSCMIRNSR